MRIEYAILFFCILNTLLLTVAIFGLRDIHARILDFVHHFLTFESHLLDMERITTAGMGRLTDVLKDLLTEVKGENNGVEESNVQ